MSGMISRNVLIFGLGIRLLLLVDLVDPAGLVTVVDGEIEAAVTQRGERKRIALHLAGLSVDSVPPRELDLLALRGLPRQRVAANNVRLDQERCGLMQVGLGAAGFAVG